MSVPADAPAPLAQLLAGKRISSRLPISLPVRIKALHAEFDAWVEDLSPEGAHLRLEKSSLLEEGEAVPGAAEQLALVEKHFRASFDLHFHPALVVVEAELRRLTLGTDGSPCLGLGCHFIHPLSETQQRKLGLGVAEGFSALWEEAFAQAQLTYVADPSRPVAGLLLDDYAIVRGPLLLGRLTRLGRRTLVLHVQGTAPTVVAAGLTGGHPRLRLLRGAHELATVAVHCLALRYVDAPRPGTEALLELPGRPPRALRRLFGRTPPE